MKFKDLNPTLKIKKILRKRAIKNVEEHISYQQKKVSDYSVDEVILATNLTVEGEATADYLSDLMASSEVQISRLARGVPVGGELEYMDSNTLNQAFSDRRTVRVEFA